MDVHDLEKGCADLTLDEEEFGGLDTPVQDQASGSTVYYELVGRFLTDRSIKFEQMQQVLASVWRPMMGMRVLPVNENLFLFQFPHARDMQRAIDDGPWSFENHTLVCKELTRQTQPEEVVLDSVDFWVQIHDLPAVYASTEFVEQIGNYVGLFVAADPNNFGGNWRSFFRVRVTLKVDEPLKRRMKLRRRDGTFQWITFRYERLNTFCFCCGLLGHSDKFCKKVYEEGILPKDYPYGGWMRAGARRQAKPVGAKWLLSDLPAKAAFVEAAPRSTTANPDQLEAGIVLHGEHKRRRENMSSHEGTIVGDTNMTEASKNLATAGRESQTRPSQ